MFLHEIHSKNHPKIIFLGKLLNQGLQTNRVIFRLNEIFNLVPRALPWGRGCEILARYLRKGAEIGEKKAFNQTAP